MAEKNDILIDLTTENTNSNQANGAPPLIISLPFDDERRLSYENNPFDKAEKEMRLYNDPFEMVLKEAMQKPSEETVNIPAYYVKTDNLIVIDDSPDCSLDITKDTSRKGNCFLNVSERLSSISSNGSDLNVTLANSQASVNKGFRTETSLQTSDLNCTSATTLNKGFVMFDSPQRALNYALINRQSLSAKRSPVLGTKCSSKCQRTQSDTTAVLEERKSTALDLNSQTRNSISHPINKFDLRRFSLSNSLIHTQKCDDSMDNSVFINANSLANSFGNSLRNHTDDSVEDISALRPHWIDSENEGDSDIEEMNIPFLQIDENKSNTPAVENTTNLHQKFLNFCHETDTNFQKDTVENEQDPNETLQNLQIVSPDRQIEENIINNTVIPDKSVESINDIVSLMNSLKAAVGHCQNEKTKADATTLLDNLNEVLNSDQNSKMDQVDETATPPLITRQGTFSYDKNEVTVEPKSEQKGNQNVATPLKDILSNQAISILQTNLSQLISKGSDNPTYIVVMNQSQLGSLNTPMQPPISTSPISSRRRSKSLSTAERPKTAVVAFQQETEPKNSHVFSTPVSTAAKRRKSFSYSSTASIAERPNVARRSVYSTRSPRENTKPSPSKLTPRKSILKCKDRVSPSKLTPRKSILKDSKQSMSLNTAAPFANQSKFKLKVSNKTGLSGPLKATIPINKLAPLHVTSSVSSPIESESSKQFTTSTPVLMRIPNTNGGPNNIPTASSTPIIRIQGPIEPSNECQNSVKSRPQTTPIKSRLSYLSTTPNPKGNSMISRLGRQRTMTDLTKKNSTNLGEETKPNQMIDRSKLMHGIQKPRSNSLSLPNKENRLSYRK